MQHELDQFLEYLKVTRNFSRHTVIAYQADITQFKDFILAEYPDLSLPFEIKQLHVRDWVGHLAESGLLPRSIRRKRSALSRFFKFCIKHDVIKTNPVAGTPVPKIPSRIVQFYDEGSLQNLETIDTGDKFFTLRDVLIIELLYGTGMRRAELCSLKGNSVDLNQQQLKVLGKGNKERIIPIPDTLRDLLSEYQLLKASKGFTTSELLTNDKGEPVNGAFVYRKVKAIMSSNSTLTKNSPHVLRHSYATHLLAGGADLNAVKELLGHSSLAATQVYTHVNIGGLLEAYRRAHPKS